MPVMMFAILFGLSMDYEVFLISASERSTRSTATPAGPSPTGSPAPRA
jgi:uncharacterized membrane protein YdfJ with MMPL/SSD domain